MALARGELAPKKPSPPLVIRWLGSRVLRYAAISRIHSSSMSSHSGTCDGYPAGRETPSLAGKPAADTIAQLQRSRCSDDSCNAVACQERCGTFSRSHELQFSLVKLLLAACGQVAHVRQKVTLAHPPSLTARLIHQVPSEYGGVIPVQPPADAVHALDERPAQRQSAMVSLGEITDRHRAGTEGSGEMKSAA